MPARCNVVVDGGRGSGEGKKQTNATDDERGEMCDEFARPDVTTTVSRFFKGLHRCPSMVCTGSRRLS